MRLPAGDSLQTQMLQNQCAPLMPLIFDLIWKDARHAKWSYGVTVWQRKAKLLT